MSCELFGDGQIQSYALDWYFKKFLTKSIWVSYGLLFKDLGVQKTPRRPAG